MQQKPRRWRQQPIEHATSPGSFAEAEYLTEAVNLYAAALRLNKLLHYDAATTRITNAADANKYLKREYRKVWNPDAI